MKITIIHLKIGDTTMKKFRVYQLPVEHNAKFMRLSFVKKHNIMPKLEDYKPVWEGEMDLGVEKSVNVQLDIIYRRFNVARPKDFKGHSLSMSDIVEIDGKYFYCDDFGWEDVTELVKPADLHKVTLAEPHIHLTKDGNILYGTTKIGTYEKDDLWKKQGGTRDRSGNKTVPFLYYVTIDAMPTDRGKRIFFSRREIKEWLSGKQITIDFNAA